MKSLYISFLRRLLLFTLILGIISIVMWLVIPDRIVTPALPFLLFLFLSVTLLSYYLQLKSQTERFIRFVNAYMLLMAAKLFLYIIIIVAYAFAFRTDIIPFMIAFFILYLCYSIFEAVSLLRDQGNARK